MASSRNSLMRTGMDAESSEAEEEQELEEEEEVEESYIDSITAAYEEETDYDFAELMSLEHEHCSSSDFLLSPEHLSRVEDELSPPLPELVGLHLQVLENLLNKNFDKALNVQINLVQAFCREFQEQKDGNWGMKTMETMCCDLRKIAYTAGITEDPMIRSEENSPTCMERAADVIMGLFRVCAADSRVQEKESRRWAMLMLVNQLFKVYFKINRLQLCKPLIRAIETQPSMDNFPPEQIVTYKYYVGRKALFDSELRVAESALQYAFDHSSPYPASVNKRKVLIYLIPVKMFLGYLPTEEALRKYDLLEFLGLSQSIRHGSFRQFYEALKANESMFISNGIYLILMKLRMLLFRNLFKKVCLLQDGNQVPIELFGIALKWSGYDDVDDDEVQCLLANLIYDGQIRGYISHQHQMVVIAKTNPFPKLSSD